MAISNTDGIALTKRKHNHKAVTIRLNRCITPLYLGVVFFQLTTTQPHNRAENHPYIKKKRGLSNRDDVLDAFVKKEKKKQITLNPTFY